MNEEPSPSTFRGSCRSAGAISFRPRFPWRRSIASGRPAWTGWSAK